MVAAASLTGVSSVYASDLPLAGVIEAASLPTDTTLWSGCYVGASVGYLSQTTDTVLAASGNRPT